jgi:hypothetical protein
LSREDHRKHGEELEHLRQETRRLKELSEHKLHPVFHYVLRTMGAASLLFGGAAIMGGISFLWPTVFISLGLLVLAIDPWLEPAIRPYRSAKIIISGFFSFFFGLFCVFVVFVSSPLHLSADEDWGNVPPHTSVGSQEWNPLWIELRVSISNPTEHDYTDVDLPMIPDLAVVKVWQDTDGMGIPGVSFLPNSPMLVEPSIRSKSPDGSISSNSLQNSGVKASRGIGYRLRCPLLPKHSILRVVFALIDDGEKDDAMILEEWLAQPNPKKLPKWVKISGTYKGVMGQEHGISQTLRPQAPSLP